MMIGLNLQGVVSVGHVGTAQTGYGGERKGLLMLPWWIRAAHKKERERESVGGRRFSIKEFGDKE